jgi:hypothetical protein
MQDLRAADANFDEKLLIAEASGATEEEEMAQLASRDIGVNAVSPALYGPTRFGYFCETCDNFMTQKKIVPDFFARCLKTDVEGKRRLEVEKDDAARVFVAERTFVRREA